MLESSVSPSDLASLAARLPAHKSLLLACARTRLDEAAHSRIETLVPFVSDWDGLISAAQRHGLLPLLYRSLAVVRAGAVPDASLSNLREQAERIDSRNGRITHELCTILQLFDDQGVEAWGSGGPLLAHLVYGDIALRQFGDPDVVIRKRDVGKAIELLAELGYEPHAIGYGTRPGNARSGDARSGDAIGLQLAYDYHLPFYDSRRQCTVDIQWEIGIDWYPRITARELWPRLRPMKFRGVRCLTPSPEDTLLLLSRHGSRHRWEKIGWLCDVSELLHGVDIDIEQTLGRAKQAGMARIFLHTLELAGALFCVDIPQPIRRAIAADAAVSALSGNVMDRLFDPAKDRGLTFDLSTMERLRDKLYYGWRRVTAVTDADRQCVLLPRPLRFLYSPLRIVRALMPKLRPRSSG